MTNLKLRDVKAETAARFLAGHGIMPDNKIINTKALNDFNAFLKGIPDPVMAQIMQPSIKPINRRMPMLIDTVDALRREALVMKRKIGMSGRFAAQQQAIAKAAPERAPIQTQVAKMRRHVRTVMDSMVSAPNRHNIVSALVAIGYRELGRGHFSIALEHPKHPDVVLKVAYTRPSSGRLDGFPAYAKWIMETKPKSKHALRVYHYEQVSDENEGTYVTITERLDHGRGNPELTDKKWAVTGALPYVRTASTDRLPRHVPRSAVEYLSKVADLGGHFDLHGDNVMVRKNGDVVVTDPITMN